MIVNETHLARALRKAERLAQTYERLLFRRCFDVPVEALETDAHTYAPPADGYRPIAPGDAWGHEWGNLWLRGAAEVPAALADTPLYLLPRLGGWEGVLYLDGVPRGNFTNKFTVDTHGNHYAARLTPGAPAGTALPFHLEYYAGHRIAGQHPLTPPEFASFRHRFERVSVAVKRQAVSDFLFDLRALLSLTRALPESSFRRGDVARGLCEAVRLAIEDPALVEEAAWTAALARAREVMAPLLAAKNAQSAAEVALIGHSHMDTAWLWPVSETIRKCARTFGNALALMDEYPEFRFFQSSPYHLEMMRRHYPALFEAIRARAAEGRWEAGGAAYIECDCNMVSGESLVRQFLWGQKYTEKWLGTRSDCFWLPDTFGYSAAIPQIMRQCGVRYFFTTKLSWNDTNRFPHDTFWWEGLDGSRVLTHFNATHVAPDPETLVAYTAGNDDPAFTQEIRHKALSRRKLIAFGLGDGGGGPEFEMCETARRVRDLDGCPRADYAAVSDFGAALEAEARRNGAPVHAGELYLELHRGTLTNKHDIKRQNRKAERALHDLELLTVLRAVGEGAPADDAAIRPHYETLLVNQFHDILPGSCIERAHRDSIAQMGEMLRAVEALTEETLAAAPDSRLTVWNPLGAARRDTVYLPGAHPCGQAFTDVFGRELTAVEGVALPPMGAAALDPARPAPPAETPFTWDDTALETPFYRVQWDENGHFASLFDKRAQRELRRGLPLGAFLMAEDVPDHWDNWDIDPDADFRPCGALLSRALVSAGAGQLRFRCAWRLTEKTTLTQDVVFFAARPEIEFWTRVDWNEKHRFLKAAFDTDIRAPFARHEIQFGSIARPTTRNDSREQAMFEVCQHKYTDLSEPRYGCAVLSDCKYGVSVEGGSIRLSLHKAGCRPDESGDAGVHDFVYALLPHEGALAAETVVDAAYRLNAPVRVFAGVRALPEAPLTLDRPNLIIEAVKPLHETAGRACAVRIYECEGGRTRATARFAPYVKAAVQADLLETEGAALAVPEAALDFGPFEIKTLILKY